MEDEEGIGLILARATELRLKISDCIDTSSTAVSDGVHSGGRKDGSSPAKKDEFIGNQEKDSDEEEAERLLCIRDALESLESQPAALQVRNPKFNLPLCLFVDWVWIGFTVLILSLCGNDFFGNKIYCLMVIDWFSCNKTRIFAKDNNMRSKWLSLRLITAGRCWLREAQGLQRERIWSATRGFDFAGKRVDYENDLLLPPYHVHPHLPSKHKKSDVNGFGSGHVRKVNPNGGSGVIIGFLGSVAKIMLPLIGVISILKRGASLKLLQQQVVRAPNQCPRGKVLVFGDGEARCLVKERVEIPFDSVVAKRDVTYGYGWVEKLPSLYSLPPGFRV